MGCSGEIKEKKTAHREYREAISKGHGAYLMDEEEPVSQSTKFHNELDFIILQKITRKKKKWIVHVFGRSRRSYLLQFFRLVQKINIRKIFGM